jgi:hypothetical protein
MVDCNTLCGEVAFHSLRIMIIGWSTATLSEVRLFKKNLSFADLLTSTDEII